MSKARDVSRLFSKTGSSSSDVGSSVSLSDNPPASAAAGDTWFNTTNLKTYIYYDDGTSTQWTPATPMISGPAGPSSNLSAVAENILPDADSSRDLGSPTKKWKSLYLSSDTLFLGDSGSISAGPGGEIVLPSIKIGKGANAVRLEAATDGKLKTKQITGGVEQPETSANAATVSASAPANPNSGDTWFDTTDATLNVYYNDGSSAQWVGIN